MGLAAVVRKGEVFWSPSGRRFTVSRCNKRTGMFRLLSSEWGVRLQRDYTLVDIEAGVLVKRRPRGRR